MATHRRDRINVEVMRELASIIRELKDPRIPVMTSVVKVTVTPDLKFAKAYISVMGTPEEQKECLNGLHSASGFIRREIGNRVALRLTPQFFFQLDDSVAHGAHISKLLKELDIPEES